MKMTQILIFLLFIFIFFTIFSVFYFNLSTLNTSSSFSSSSSSSSFSSIHSSSSSSTTSTRNYFNQNQHQNQHQKETYFEIISNFQEITKKNNENSLTYIIEKPLNINKLNGIVFIAHACTHSSYDFWIPSNKCKECIGLAEETEIKNLILLEKYYVIAITSSDRESGCWSNDDINDVIEILNYTYHKVQDEYKVMKYNHLQNHTKLNKLPMFAFGCSSGGRFIWALHKELATYDNPPFLLDGLIIQVMSLPIHSITPPKYITPNLEIPIIFNPMIRDKFGYDAVLDNYNTLISDYLYTPELIRVVTCYSLPLTPEYMLKRLYYLNLTLSEIMNIITILKQDNYLNETSYFIKDPTAEQNNWRELIKLKLSKETLSKLVLDRGKSPLAKVFNRCWAFHEYCADNILENLLWLRKIRQRQLLGLPLKVEQD